MKINRAIGLLIFLFVGQFIFAGVIASLSSATISLLETVEVAAMSMQHNLQQP